MQAIVGADNRSLSSMATDELMDLFRLDGAMTAAAAVDGAEPSAKKRRRRAEDAQSGEEQYSIEELWEATWQYEDEHSVHAFKERI